MTIEQWKEIHKSMLEMSESDLRTLLINVAFEVSNQHRANDFILDTPVNRVVFISIRVKDKEAEVVSDPQ